MQEVYRAISIPLFRLGITHMPLGSLVKYLGYLGSLHSSRPQTSLHGPLHMRFRSWTLNSNMSLPLARLMKLPLLLHLLPAWALKLDLRANLVALQSTLRLHLLLQGGCALLKSVGVRVS